MDRDNHEVLVEKGMPSVFAFVARQPDGHEVTIDMSTQGGFGDFAFTVRDGGDVKHFFAYWTSESSIFTDIMSRLRQRPDEKLVSDVAHIRDALVDLVAQGYTATDQGEGKMSIWAIERAMAQPTELLRHYRMYSGGDDVLAVRLDDQDGVCISTERMMDTEVRCDEVVIPEDDLWRFAAGMIARSYSDDGRSYTQLTRFSTAQYERALAVCLGEAHEN